MTRSYLIQAVVVCVALAAGTTAHADPRVVLVEPAAGPTFEALATQVQLQSEDVTVTTVAANDAGGPGFVATAAQLAVEHDAILVVWVTAEASSGATETYVVYAVGRTPDRALIELVRVDAATPASEVERVIALKVAGLVDALLAPAPAAAVLDVPVPVVPASPAPRRRSTSWVIDVGAAVAAAGGDRGATPGIVVAGSHRWRVSRGSLGVGLEARWLPSYGIDGPVARVSIVETDVVAGAEAALDLGPVDLVARGWGSAAVLAARGATPDGRTGSLVEMVPWLGASLGIRLPVGDPIELGISLGGERALIHQRFLADGVVVADVGEARLLAVATMSVRLR